VSQVKDEHHGPLKEGRLYYTSSGVHGVLTRRQPGSLIPYCVALIADSGKAELKAFRLRAQLKKVAFEDRNGDKSEHESAFNVSLSRTPGLGMHDGEQICQ
jgi:hypothetical protein